MGKIILKWVVLGPFVAGASLLRWLWVGPGSYRDDV